MVNAFSISKYYRPFITVIFLKEERDYSARVTDASSIPFNPAYYFVSGILFRKIKPRSFCIFRLKHCVSCYAFDKAANFPRVTLKCGINYFYTGAYFLLYAYTRGLRTLFIVIKVRPCVPQQPDTKSNPETSRFTAKVVLWNADIAARLLASLHPT